MDQTGGLVGNGGSDKVQRCLLEHLFGLGIEEMHLVHLQGDLHFLAEINDVSVVTPYPEDLPNWLCNTLNTLRENTW